MTLIDSQQRKLTRFSLEMFAKFDFIAWLCIHNYDNWVICNILTNRSGSTSICVTFLGETNNFLLVIGVLFSDYWWVCGWFFINKYVVLGEWSSWNSNDCFMEATCLWWSTDWGASHRRCLEETIWVLLWMSIWSGKIRGLSNPIWITFIDEWKNIKVSA